MHGALTYGQYGTASRDRTRALFGQTMGLVAVTAAFFALGSYVGRNLSHTVAIGAYIAAFVCLLIMRFAARRSGTASTGVVVTVSLPLSSVMPRRIELRPSRSSSASSHNGSREATAPM